MIDYDFKKFIIAKVATYQYYAKWYLMILYRDLIEIFPNCKVILTVASDSSVWYELVKSSLHSPEELTKVQQNDGKHKYLNLNKKGI